MGTFNEDAFERKLLQLRETHESISNLSSWCLANQTHHYKIVSTWLSVLKKVKIEHRLILFYLANDVIQYSRRKHLPFVETFAPALQKATTLVREDSVKNKILRLFKIWDERGVYDEAFLLDLSGLLICDPKGTRVDVQDFQPNVMYSRIRSCKKLEDDTDLKLKILNESKIPLTDVDKLRKSLKEREHGEDLMDEVDKALKKIKAYVDALEAEIKERSGLIDLLETGEQYYEKDFREAKIVLNAYRCFGVRVKQVQKKLEEKITELPSPIPSPPDINAPSPPSSPGIGDRDMSSISESDFTLGDSFVNNPSSILESSLETSHSEVPSQSFYKNSQSLINNYYIPPVYNPKMTTGEMKMPPETKKDQSEEPYSPFDGSSNLYNDSLSDQKYSEEFFTGTPVKESQAYSVLPQKTNVEASDYVLNSTKDSVKIRKDDDSFKDLPINPVNPNIDTDVFSFLQQFGKNQMGENSLFAAPPPPPPPPPPEMESPESPKPEVKSNDSSSEGKKIEVISSIPKKMSITDILQTLMPKSEPPVPLKPPPLPPTALQMSDSAQQFSWGESASEWDSPQSPPTFEDTYSSPSVGYEKLVIAGDVDMRTKDVDHRNLINLTGSLSSGWSDDECKSSPVKQSVPKYRPSSPKQEVKPLIPDYTLLLKDFKCEIKGDSVPDYKPTIPNDSKQSNIPNYKPTPIRDYRPAPLPEIKHPPIPDYVPTPVTDKVTSDNKVNMDIVENVDMEMSDEEDKKDSETCEIEVMGTENRMNTVSSENTYTPSAIIPTINSFALSRGGLIGTVIAPPPPPPPPSPRDPTTWLPPPPTYSPHPQFPNRPFTPRRPQGFPNLSPRPFRHPLRHFNRPPRFQQW